MPLIRCNAVSVSPPSRSPRPRGRRGACLAVAGALAWLACSAPTSAAIRTWDGDGPNATWSGVSVDIGSSGRTNWVGTFVIPANGDDLHFAGTARLTSTNDYLSSIGDLRFNAGAGAFVLEGNGLTIQSDFVNDSGSVQTLRLPVAVGAPVGTSPQWFGGHHGVILEGLFSVGDHSVLLDNFRVLNGGSALTIGDAAFGYLRVTGGSSVAKRRALLGVQAGSTGNLVLDSRGSSLTVVEDVSVGMAGRSNFVVSQGATATLGFMVIGNTAGASGEVAVVGQDTEMRVLRSLTVGREGRGEFTVAGGGQAFADEGTIGSSVGEGGFVTVIGPGAALTVNTFLTVGAARDPFRDARHGLGVLNIEDEGRVSTDLLSIGDGGVVNLIGGRLETRAFSSTGVFNWKAGTLAVTDPSGASLGSGALPNVLTLTPLMRLESGGALTVGGGKVLVLAGGQIAATGLALAGGTVVASGGPIDLSGIGNLIGGGLVAGPIVGGAGRLIKADGSLTLGDAGTVSGFVFDGELDVGRNSVVLLSSGKAILGVRTSLIEDGRLSVPNGAQLAAGRELRFDGNATVLGYFLNDGVVNGAGGTLTFLNDVAGSGDFAGDIVFRAGYSPGQSPAIIDFQGGDASFDDTSLLEMEVFGPTPGLEHDQLIGIDRLRFEGRLRLVFGAGASLAPGQRLSLFEFQSFEGAFTPDRIQVAGYDRQALDLSRLAVDGTIAAVPEAQTWALLSAGLVLMGWHARKARRTHRRALAPVVGDPAA